MKILKLKPSCKDYLWGGRRLIEEFGKDFAGDILAETWEISCHKDGLSTISNGDDKEKTLLAYIQENGKECLGSNASSYTEFPILVKLIDARDDLSIQVHPSDSYALEHENQYGKTEMWYVVDAKEGAFLYYGFSKTVSKEELKERIQNNTLLEVLNKVPVKKGDSFFIEPGTIHAIGKDILIAEIQQNSNVTYRVYDYGRVDANGKGRELHIAKAVDVINRKQCLQSKKFDSHLADCNYFTVDKIVIDQTYRDTVTTDSFVGLLFVEGEGSLLDSSTTLDYKKGDAFFIPAQERNYEIKGTGVALKITIPSPC